MEMRDWLRSFDSPANKVDIDHKVIYCYRSCWLWSKYLLLLSSSDSNRVLVPLVSPRLFSAGLCKASRFFVFDCGEEYGIRSSFCRRRLPRNRPCRRRPCPCDSFGVSSSSSL